MMRCGQETTTVPMRRNEGTGCHDQKLPSLDLQRTMPDKDSKEERTFKGLDCATPGPHLRSDYTLTGMRAGCCTSDRKRGVYNVPDHLTKTHQWPHLAAFVHVFSERTIKEKTSCSERIFLFSKCPDAKTAARLIRGHWEIENSLHWSLDVVMSNDDHQWES